MDRLEAAAIREVFGGQSPRPAVSSVKGMTGDTLGASGLLQLIAALGAIETGAVPPTVGLASADDETSLDFVKGGGCPEGCRCRSRQLHRCWRQRGVLGGGEGD